MNTLLHQRRVPTAQSAVESGEEDFKKTMEPAGMRERGNLYVHLTGKRL